MCPPSLSSLTAALGITDILSFICVCCCDVLGFQCLRSMSHLLLLSRRSLLSLLSVGDPVAVCLHLYCDSSATRLPAAVTALTSDAVNPETFVRLYIACSKCCLRSNIRSHLPSFSALPSIAPFAVMACNSCKRSTRARRIVCRYSIGVQAVTPWTSRTQTFRTTTIGSQRHGRRKSRRLGGLS